MAGVEVLAPAKLNLTLEVLSRRSDGYHEIVSILQTIDLEDSLRVQSAPTISLSVGGKERSGVPVDSSQNLVHKAATALAAKSGRPDLGASIELAKGIPVSSGLGGGSSNAAATLRALNLLWGLGLSLAELDTVAADLGSDVPFFLHGGSASVSGRGEAVTPLEDIEETEFTLFLGSSSIDDKTKSMYSRLTPSDYSDGARTWRLAQSLQQGEELDEACLLNVFDPHVGDLSHESFEAMAACRQAGLRVFACGSGPGFFSVLPFLEVSPDLLYDLDRNWGIRTVSCRSLTRREAMAFREV